MSSIPLEEIVKNNLGNYEARYDANDWGRMEAMLGTTTDSSTFNWKPVLIIIIVLAVLGGGYAVFTNIDFSKHTEKEVATPAISTPPPVVKKTVTPPVKKDAPSPVIIRPVNVDSIKKVIEDARIAKEEEDRKAAEEAEKEEARLKKERKKEEPTKEELEAREARRAKRRALADSNKTKEDSSKALIKEPKKEKSKSSGIGLNIFSTFNADSLKKYQEKLKKDSVK